MNVVCMGETLIDFVCTDQNTSMADSTHFIKKSGGAPANVAACIAKLGGSSLFAGAVGHDPFGDSLINELTQYGVKTEFIKRSLKPTTMAFISLMADGERDFVFNRGADSDFDLTQTQINQLLDNAILHLGAATALLGDTLYQTYLKTAQTAKHNQQLISFDPNYRVDLWPNRLAEFIEKSLEFIKLADMVKVSEEELELLTGQSDLAKGCDQLHELGVKIITVTIGAKGCYLSTVAQKSIIPAYQITPIDTTGAGDAFIGALLFQLAQQPTSDYQTLSEYVLFANKVSGLVCEHYGPMTGLNDYQTIIKTTRALKQ
ncbi:carbohydrate kinase [Catenovulum sp. 2E275]|uniref:carbohydrate kinase family protein n=1 Tax=Catenovulum sp. 2E275 TaxID=2980497 RepID=UPI0021D29235|nr:carbohydrate kinase [Catenovulum sp. 2E275]MCU4677017.1 carbohydrate kinase [Catenovulum sp. 2E275]